MARKKDDFEKYLKKQLKDPEFRKEYEKLEPLYASIRKKIKNMKKRYINGYTKVPEDASEAKALVQTQASALESESLQKKALELTKNEKLNKEMEEWDVTTGDEIDGEEE